MPTLVTDLEGAKIQLVCHREKNHPVLAKEKLLALDELWSQHEVHWMLATAWWCSAFCHPYVP